MLGSLAMARPPLPIRTRAARVALGEKLARARRNAGTSQEELALLLGITRAKLRDIELGMASFPAELAGLTAELLDISVVDLFDDVPVVARITAPVFTTAA